MRLLLSLALLILPTLSLAQEARTERVQFPSGSSGTKVSGQITGYDTVDYLVSIRAGQEISVTMSTDNRASYFNLYAPGTTPDNDRAAFTGSTSGLEFKDPIFSGGDMLVRVYMMRSAARRDEVANYALEIVAGGVVVRQPSTSAGYDATGLVGCARTPDEPMSQCSFGVKRQPVATAEVTVYWPDQGTRVLLFKEGAFVGTEQKTTERDITSGASRAGGRWTIGVGRERFEVPDEVVFGG